VSGSVNACKSRNDADECHSGKLTANDPIISFEGFASTKPEGGVGGFILTTKSGKSLTLGNFDAAARANVASLGVKPISKDESIIGMKFDF